MIFIIFCLHTGMLESPSSQNMSMKLKDFFSDSTFYISHSSSPHMCKFSYATANDLGWGMKKSTQANCQELMYVSKSKKMNQTSDSVLHYKKQCYEK